MNAAPQEERFDEVMLVSVVGAGAGGRAFAVDLITRGRSVLLYGHPGHLGAVPAIKTDGFLKAAGEIEGIVKPKVTSDMAEVVRFSTFIIIMVPANGQDSILQELMQCDIRQHTLILTPGNFFALWARGKGLSPQRIVETSILPYAAKMAGNTV